MNVLITLGPTREPIDSVRYITNASSGKMGAALAEQALKRGHKVKIIAGPVTIKLPEKAKTVSVVTAEEMTKAALKHLKGIDVLIATAAVADYAPEKKGKKIRSGKKQLILRLKPTKKLTREARKKYPGLYIVAFKAEHDVSEKELLDSAEKKLSREGLDLIAANDVSRNRFGSDFNQVTLIDNSGRKKSLRKQTKKAIAKEIWEKIEEGIKA